MTANGKKAIGYWLQKKTCYLMLYLEFSLSQNRSR
jgi:hypothetical protein